MLSSSLVGPGNAQRFSGPAVVERSTSSDLVLAFEFPAAAAGAPPIISHLAVTGLSPMPRIAVGKRVWLERDEGGGTGSSFGAPPASSFRVTDEQAGKLLLGTTSTNSTFSTTGAAPLRVVGLHDRCTERLSSCQYTWKAVEVAADETVLLEPGKPTEVMLDGGAYNAVAFASKHGVCGADDVALESVYVSVVARDVEAMAADLPLAEPPACSQYNDVDSSTSFTLYGVSVSTDYAGPVVYKSSGVQGSWTEHEFDTPELVPLPGAQASLGLEDWSNDFLPPQVGTTLYFESRSFMAGALLTEKGGAPVFVTAITFEPFDDAMLATLSGWLGVAVAFQRSCDYTNVEAIDGTKVLPLWQANLGTKPPTVVHTGERTRFDIGGRAYEAYVGGVDAITFTVRSL